MPTVSTSQLSIPVELSVPVFDSGGNETDRITVPKEALGSHIRPGLIQRALRLYGQRCRSGTASAKSRGQIRRSNRKPWPQKGTGHARAGTRRSPIWRGGGVTFGPMARDYKAGMNRKQRRLAMKSALLWKIADGEVKAVEGLSIEEPKTREMARLLKALRMERGCLIGLQEVPSAVFLSARNIPGVTVVPVAEFNAYLVVRKPQILLSRGALYSITGREPGQEEES